MPRCSYEAKFSQAELQVAALEVLRDYWSDQSQVVSKVTLEFIFDLFDIFDLYFMMMYRKLISILLSLKRLLANKKVGWLGRVFLCLETVDRLDRSCMPYFGSRSCQPEIFLFRWLAAHLCAWRTGTSCNLPVKPGRSCAVVWSVYPPEHKDWPSQRPEVFGLQWNGLDTKVA